MVLTSAGDPGQYAGGRSSVGAFATAISIGVESTCRHWDTALKSDHQRVDSGNHSSISVDAPCGADSLKLDVTLLDVTV